MLAVVPVLDFTTGLPIRKGRLLEPGPQTLTVTVTNYLRRDVEGTLTIGLPAEWGGDRTLQFSAPAGGTSGHISVRLDVPTGPEPWQRVTTQNAAGGLTVEAPAGTNPRPRVTLSGTLSDGTPLPEVVYEPNVGRLPQ